MDLTCNERITSYHLLYCLVVALVKAVDVQQTNIKDYCAFESFTPKCNDNQVVVMNSAVYGRMARGRCVQRDYGHLGCKADALSYFDKQCSGRRTCQVDVPSETLTQQLSCLGELNPYLEASFDCQEIYVPENSLCHTVHYTTAKKSAQYLSSLITQETLCGLHNTPFVVTARPGQVLRLSLIDFSWTAPDNGAVDHSCKQTYGYIVDTETNDYINICGSAQRRHDLYVSTGSSVQIVMDSVAVQSHKFLISYEALGCPDITPPVNSFVTKSNDTITIECQATAEKWRLTCVDNMWLGILGNCSGDGIGVYKVLGEEHSDGQGEPGHIFTRNHVLAFTLGCVTVIVCCATVIIGMYCIKRHDSRRTGDSPSLHYDDATIVSRRSAMGFQPIHSSTLQIRDRHPMDHPSCTLPMLRGNPPLVPKRSSSYTTNSISRLPNRPNYFNPHHNGSDMKYFSQVRNPQCFSQNQFGSQFMESFQTDRNCNNFPASKQETGSQLFPDVFDDASSNAVQQSRMTGNHANSACCDPVHYFVLETPRESVTSENEQLYQSILYRSTDHITS